jgi:multiple sugar transport system ATP-binding protein
MASVSFSNVWKIYPSKKGDVEAVKDVNIEVQDREFVVLVGPSGCGKSTTLRMVAGLEEISKGTIRIDDRVVNDLPPKDCDIAMVFQNYALYPHMSVFDNMAFGLKLRKYPKAEIIKRVNEAAGILGIEGLLDRKPKALSGGQRQRVAAGRAIVRQPKVFLFDEPLSNLDAKMRVQMRTEITRLHQRLDATMLYVTHDQVEAMTMGSRIVVMKDGVIQQNDAPLTLYNRPANLFVAGFLGSPPMNFLHGELLRSDSKIVFHEKGGTAKCSLPEIHSGLDSFIGRQVVLGIRPEDIEIAAHSRAQQAEKFDASVELVEPLGAETNLYLTTGAHSVICRSQVAFDHSITGKNMAFAINRLKIHLFDPDSSNRIGP